MLSPLPELRGSQTPRIRSAPPSSYSLADEVLDLVMLAGRIHIPWQAAATTDIMACRSDGKWAAKEVGLLVARQNGKSAVVENVELGWMVFEPGVQILHTAHEMPAALESMRKLIALFDGHRDLRKLIAPRGIRKRGGEEGITLRNGSRILFRSRTDSAGRSFSGERIVYDEAMIITPESENALSNILTTALLQRLAAVRGRLSLCADQAAAAKWWLSMPMASVSAEGPMPKALSTRRTSPLMPGCRHQGRACPLRRARMTSNPLIVA